jgi:CheY-like chemotaxis protein
MAGMDGYETARRIRERPEGRNLILVAMTGWGSEADARRATAAGFNLHLPKPVDPTILEKVLALAGAHASRLT